MKVLVFSISSPPEKTGTGKYNAEMIEYLANNGHQTRLLTTLPYYPEWKLLEGYRSKLFRKEKFGKAEVIRVWSFLPRKVNAKTRIIKEASFFLLSLLYFIQQKIKGYKPDAILYIAPPFFLPFLTRFIYKSSKHVYHIQDFEVDAAIELKMLPSFMEKILKTIETKILHQMNLITTISEGMVKKLTSKGDFSNIYLFPNWSNTSLIYPAPSTWLHRNLGIEENKKLIVYSGNIGLKQGLNKLPSIIKEFEDFKEVHFVIIGEGAYKRQLMIELKNTHLQNYSIRGLVEKNELNDMLNSSFLQLVLQKSEGADAFLPSKLTDILAAGIPSIVTTLPETGLYELVKEHNCAIPVGDSIKEIKDGILFAMNNPKDIQLIKDYPGCTPSSQMERGWREVSSGTATVPSDLVLVTLTFSKRIVT